MELKPKRFSVFPVCLMGYWLLWETWTLLEGGLQLAGVTKEKPLKTSVRENEVTAKFPNE
jgi:hypothetical protein